MWPHHVVEVEVREPTRRACTLASEIVVAEGTSADYKRMAHYHYRNTGFPPGKRAVYAAHHTPTRALVGVIVYTVPAQALSARSRVLPEYKPGGGDPESRAAASKRVNADIELISRVVVHPTFRGVGLGARLISTTLPLRGKKFIEMSAAMGGVNPFAVKAGMEEYHGEPSPATVRILAELRAIGATDEEIANPQALLRLLGTLDERVHQRVVAAMLEYERVWLRGKTNRRLHLSVETAADRISRNVLLQPRYYLWRNPALVRQGAGTALGSTP